jgi:hypothetical protein
VRISERVRWITHKEEQILFSNFSSLGEEQYLKEMEETTAMLRRAVEKKPLYLLALTDVTNTTTTAKITEKSEACRMLLEGVTASTAIVGLTETKRGIARIVSPDLRAFEDPEQAKDWLASQARSGKRV